MLTRPSGARRYIEFDRPSPARVYDYLLDGACNSAADRVVAKELIAILPAARWIAQTNRAFLRRAVCYLVKRGVRQFLDVGSGIPLVGNVHEIAQKLNPECRVIYVDHDPLAFAQTKLLLQDNALADVIHQDARDYDAVVQAPEVQRLINFTEPVAVLLLMLLQAIPDDDNPAELVAGYGDAVPAGSYLACSHGTVSHSSPALDSALDLYANRVAPVSFRSRAQIMTFLSEFRLVDPGLVYLPQWRPDSAQDVGENPQACWTLGAVAKK